jgi:hypothetical protein
MSASLVERISVDEQLQSLTTLVQQLRQEVGELRREYAELRCEVGYWKSRHADAVKRNVKLQAELDQAKAEIRQLKDERFGKQSEKQSASDRSNQLDDPQQPKTPKNKRGQLRPLADPHHFEQHLNKATRNDWVVYAKQPFGDDPQQTIKYLARYTHRMAISNSRLIAIRDGYVHFRWKDYRDGAKLKPTALEGTEFIRRFLLHVLPSGFVHIRHSGLLSNRFRQEKLTLCRQLLGLSVDDEADHDPSEPRPENEVTPVAEHNIRCPKCAVGRMTIVDEIPPATAPVPNSSNAASQSRAPPILGNGIVV